MAVRIRPWVTLLSAAALVLVATSAWAQFQDNLDPFNKGAVPVDPLKINLVAYWKLGEASGTRVDSTGRGNDLTATNAPGNTTGKVGSALALVKASSQYASRASTTDLQFGDANFTVTFWFRTTDVTSDAGVVGRWDTVSGSPHGVEWLLEVFSGNLYFELHAAGGADHSVTRAISVDTWYFVVASYNAATDTMSLSVNQGTAATATHVGGADVTSVNLQMGRYHTGNYLNGIVDEVGLWKRLLTAGEQTTLYNSGNGYALFP